MARSKARQVPRCSNCARLERELHQLREELAELRRQVNRNASNSSLPPSAHPPWAPRPVNNKKPTGRRPGGQIGHEGHFRRLLPSEQVDQIVRHRPARCRHCGSGLGPGTAEQAVARHQVSELPERAVRVTEHQAIACRCEKCGLLTREPIPDALLRSVLGPRLSAVAVYVSARVHGSRRAAEELLEEVLGVPLALGTVMAREREVSAALDEPYRQAKAAIAQASSKNVDETGWKRAGKFLWVAATKDLAVFHLDPCRNRDALHQLLGVPIKGTICTDRFGVYEKVPIQRRGLCWSHLKRDFKELSEQPAAAKKLGEEGGAICKRLFDLWHQLTRGKISPSVLRRRVEDELRPRMHRLLQRGTRCRLKRAATFCRALLRLEPALWTFARVQGIEPTNNHAERMLRPAVIWRKTSQGSHAIAGCRFVERILTSIQTLRLQGRSMMDYLQQTIHAWRHGLSPPPLLA
jgi:transposase